MNNVPSTPSQGVPSELTLHSRWDTAGIRDLITKKTRAGRRPAFLFLGQHEAELLRSHLGAAFGPDSVRSLKNIYYMGLEVIELNTPSFFRTAGMKRVQGFRERVGRQPRWKDITGGSLWQFEV